MEELKQFIGLGGALAIREIVGIVKPAWETTRFNGFLNVITAMIFGVVLNVCLAKVFGTDLIVGVALGVVTGILSSVWDTVLKFANKE